MVMTELLLQVHSIFREIRNTQLWFDLNVLFEVGLPHITVGVCMETDDSGKKV